jgi:hypothetical protein
LEWIFICLQNRMGNTGAAAKQGAFVPCSLRKNPYYEPDANSRRRLEFVQAGERLEISPKNQ